jgi:hypothetical protein
MQIVTDILALVDKTGGALIPNLTTISLLFGILLLVLSCVVQCFHHFLSNSEERPTGKVFFKLIGAFSAGFALPTGFALLLAAFRPTLLNNISGIEAPLVIAALATFWGALEAFKA